MNNYYESILKSSRKRRESCEVTIGSIPLGSSHPIRVQSMTISDTMNTSATCEEILKLSESGCDYVRVTVPSIREANNLKVIKNILKNHNCKVPIIADIHFTPKAAMIAARLVEKVRINPGNYIDKKKFNILNYSKEDYDKEIDKLRKNFVPLLQICKEYGTALRIGTNHGSLSDRIMSYYGDTPLGMVESALEFLRICEEESFYNVVLSMKASNPQIMIQAYRLLVQKLEEEKMKPYPLHLGVTEAGSDMEGRVKSAIGIGTLLEEGLGDTIRVSLTEPSINEIPIAKTIIDYVNNQSHDKIKNIVSHTINKSAFSYRKRKTYSISNIGGENPPVVIADLSKNKNITMDHLK